MTFQVVELSKLHDVVEASGQTHHAGHLQLDGEVGVHAAAAQRVTGEKQAHGGAVQLSRSVEEPMV